MPAVLSVFAAGSFLQLPACCKGMQIDKSQICVAVQRKSAPILLLHVEKLVQHLQGAAEQHVWLDVACAGKSQRLSWASELRPA